MPGFVHTWNNCKAHKIGLKDVVPYGNARKSQVRACCWLSCTQWETFSHILQPLSAITTFLTVKLVTPLMISSTSRHWTNGRFTTRSDPVNEITRQGMKAHAVFVLPPHTSIGPSEPFFSVKCVATAFPERNRGTCLPDHNLLRICKRPWVRIFKYVFTFMPLNPYIAIK